MKLTNIKVMKEVTEINGVKNKYLIIKNFQVKKHYQYEVYATDNQWNLLDAFATKGEAIEYIAELEDDSI